MNKIQTKDDLRSFFQKAKGIPPAKVKYYVGWLDRFLQFYNGSLDHISDGDVKAFGDFLERNGCEGWQVKQAQEAVFLYIEKFLQKEIVFTNKNKRDDRQPFMPKTWKRGTAPLICRRPLNESIQTQAGSGPGSMCFLRTNCPWTRGVVLSGGTISAIRCCSGP